MGSRIGLVWRSDRVELIIDAVHTLTLAKDIIAPFVRIELKGHLAKMKLLPESDRSRIWSRLVIRLMSFAQIQISNFELTTILQSSRAG